MPMNLPEIQENDGATGKYHENTDTRDSGYLAVVFLA
jgi:hypothetical protein